MKGVCTGPFVVEKKLTITGGSSRAAELRGSLDVYDGSLELKNLDLTGGGLYSDGDVRLWKVRMHDGSGINNQGSLKIHRSSINHNSGMIYNFHHLELIRSEVEHNAQGIYNDFGTLKLAYASVRYNEAWDLRYFDPEFPDPQVTLICSQIGDVPHSDC